MACCRVCNKGEQKERLAKNSPISWSCIAEKPPLKQREVIAGRFCSAPMLFRRLFCRKPPERAERLGALPARAPVAHRRFPGEFSCALSCSPSEEILPPTVVIVSAFFCKIWREGQKERYLHCLGQWFRFGYCRGFWRSDDAVSPHIVKRVHNRACCFAFRRGGVYPDRLFEAFERGC